MEDLRKQLDLIDEKMRELFEQRLDVVKKVGVYKKKHQVEILDKTREKELIKRNLEALSHKEYTDYYKRFLELQLSVSKELQDKIIKTK